MKISLVTLSFNQRGFLERALRSVLGQSYPNLEYIIVDPGSTDGSRELIEEYRSMFSHVILEPDQGPADGLNRGFQLASGEIFGFLNADDLLLPGSLQKVGDHFGRHANCDVVMGDGFIVDAEDRILRHVRTHSFSVNGQFYSRNQWLQQSTFFRRECFRAVGGFNLSNRSCWDGELFLDLAAANAHFEYLRQDLGCFRVHAESYTALNKESPSRPQAVRRLADHRRIFEKVQGRQWTGIDTVRAYIARSAYLLRHPDDVIQAGADRIRQRFDRMRPPLPTPDQ